MSGQSRSLGALCFGLALLRCSGTVVTKPGDGPADSGGHAGTTSVGGDGNGGASSAPRDAGFDENTDPGCPDVGPPSQADECDPFAPVSACPTPEGCYPFVGHPFGADCGALSFGTVCLPAGVGHQDDVCGPGTGECAPGFVCVASTQPQKHCAQLCRVNDQSSCPSGRSCVEFNGEGYGGCS